MSEQITLAQRQQVAEHWRDSTEAQQMPPHQAEQFAQQILSGTADNQVSNYLSQLHGQQVHDSGALPGLNLQTPFGDTVQMPMFPYMQSIHFAGIHELPTMPRMPQMPQFPTVPQLPTVPMPQLPTMPQMPLLPPLSQPQFPGMHALPMMPAGGPQVTQQTFQFPGGLGNQQIVSLSGTSGNATFSYSSSSMSSNWSDNGAHNGARQSVPTHQGYPQPVAVEAAAPMMDSVQAVPEIPAQQPQAPAQSLYAQFPRLGPTARTTHMIHSRGCGPSPTLGTSGITCSG